MKLVGELKPVPDELRGYRVEVAAPGAKAGKADCCEIGPEGIFSIDLSKAIGKPGKASARVVLNVTLIDPDGDPVVTREVYATSGKMTAVALPSIPLIKDEGARPKERPWSRVPAAERARLGLLTYAMKAPETRAQRALQLADLIDHSQAIRRGDTNALAAFKHVLDVELPPGLTIPPVDVFDALEQALQGFEKLVPGSVGCSFTTEPALSLIDAGLMLDMTQPEPGGLYTGRAAGFARAMI